MNDTQESLDLILSVIIDDEPACEIAHRLTLCSVEVTHRLVSCRNSILMCANATEAQTAKRDSGGRCKHCLRAAGVCWKILPV